MVLVNNLVDVPVNITFKFSPDGVKNIRLVVTGTFSMKIRNMALEVFWSVGVL